MRLLVTGGTGFVGAAFVDRARRVGHEAIAMDLHGVPDVRCDLGEPDAVLRAMTAAAPEVVVHLAAQLTLEAAADPVGATRTNALGTAAVFAAAAKANARRVVYAGSIAAVGRTEGPAGDDVRLDPRTVYGTTKAFGEHLARAMSALPGQPEYVVLRLGWVYGPGRERGWRVVQEVVEQFAQGRATVRYPDFAEPMDFTYVDDVVEVLLRACERPLPHYAAFNVLGDRRTIADLVSHLQRRFPAIAAAPVPQCTPATGWDVRNDGLAEALGYAPTTSLEAGVDALLAAIARRPALSLDQASNAPMRT